MSYIAAVVLHLVDPKSYGVLVSLSAHSEDEQPYRGMTGKGEQYKIELYDQSLKSLKQTVTFI